MKDEIVIHINDQELSIEPGITILQAAINANIKIPTLCYHSDLCTSGSCRICLVEVEGYNALQPSCKFTINEPIAVKTHSKKIFHARKHILNLLLAEHQGDCFTCKKNNNCQLQNLAAEYGSNTINFVHKTNSKYPIDDTSLIIKDMNKCIQCNLCVDTCDKLQSVSALTRYARSNQTQITSFFNIPFVDTTCILCGQCINHCPTAALTEKEHIPEVRNALEDTTKQVIIQTAPSPRATIGECFGKTPGQLFTFELNTALRQCGFAQIFDTTFGADLTIIEEVTELLLRLYKSVVLNDRNIQFPMFTSCSPGWINYLEIFYPEFIPNLSTTKSPHMMLGTIIKTYFAQKMRINPSKIINVSLMPCLAKKFEITRPEMIHDRKQNIDYVLTTREMAKMLKQESIDLPNLEKSKFDSPFGHPSGSGLVFGATGGVMEAALRTAIDFITGEPIEKQDYAKNIAALRGFNNIKYAEFKINKINKQIHPLLQKTIIDDWQWCKDFNLKVGICHGTANAKKVMDDIKKGGKFSKCHFIEFMGCEGGCLGGGGQPIPTSKSIRKKRSQAIYAEASSYKVHKSHENPDIEKIYKEFLIDGPCGSISHKLLHTKYHKRKKFIDVNVE